MSRIDGVMKAADKLAKKEDQNEEVNAMTLFFRDKNGGLTPSEKELSRLKNIIIQKKE